MDDLESQLLKFPRGTHDDQIDSCQMLFSMYELQPNAQKLFNRPKYTFDKFGRPTLNALA